MEKITVKYEGIVYKLEITERYSKGIYKVFGKSVKNNCEKLTITIGGEDPLQLYQKITRLGDVAILTIKVESNFIQVIIKEYSEESEVEKLISEFPSESREALTKTYQMLKLGL